jgi:hypothetical protein
MSDIPMICKFCPKELILVNNKQAYVEDHQCDIYVCETCDAFYAITSEDPKIMVQYWFVCVEMSKNPEGNYILEFYPDKNKTKIRFLPVNETLGIQDVCTFDLILPIKPESAAEKIKTYVLFS